MFGVSVLPSISGVNAPSVSRYIMAASRFLLLSQQFLSSCNYAFFVLSEIHSGDWLGLSCVAPDLERLHIDSSSKKGPWSEGWYLVGLQWSCRLVIVRTFRSINGSVALLAQSNLVYSIGVLFNGDLAKHGRPDMVKNYMLQGIIHHCLSSSLHTTSSSAWERLHSFFQHVHDSCQQVCHLPLDLTSEHLLQRAGDEVTFILWSWSMFPLSLFTSLTVASRVITLTSVQDHFSSACRVDSTFHFAGTLLTACTSDSVADRMIGSWLECSDASFRPKHVDLTMSFLDTVRMIRKIIKNCRWDRVFKGAIVGHEMSCRTTVISCGRSVGPEIFR